VYVRAATVVLIIVHTLSGMLDIWKTVLPTSVTWLVWDNASITAAQRIQEATTPGETVVTAPTHNSTVVLAGRPRYLGYPGHVWSHGSTPWEREQSIAALYSGQLRQLPDGNPQYILVGPQERTQFGASLTVSDDWKLVLEAGKYQLYRL
ncbi:MAG: hypothetical protein ACRD4B_01385, partial [Acidobacteriota bacterium]